MTLGKVFNFSVPQYISRVFFFFFLLSLFLQPPLDPQLQPNGVTCCFLALFSLVVFADLVSLAGNAFISSCPAVVQRFLPASLSA